MSPSPEQPPPVPSTSTQPEGPPVRVKKRRLHGSCDACRKKKISVSSVLVESHTQGDSANMPDNHCTNCRVLNVPCQHTAPRLGKKKKEVQNSAGYIRRLEERLEKMERLLEKQGSPETANIDNSADSIQQYSSFSDTKEDGTRAFTPPKKLVGARLEPSSATSDDSSDPDDLAHVALSEHLSSLSIGEAVDDRFFGKSSAFMFVKEASSVRHETTRGTILPDRTKFRRPIYWDVRPWEASLSSSFQPGYIYPEVGLLQTLVSLYFEKMNTIFPILHQPTFLKALSQNQHHWDPAFGMTVLLVCAIGSRYTNDPRVIVPEDKHGLSSGWPYFSQVQIYRNPLLLNSTIYDLQYFVLAILYLSGTSVPQASWNLIGLGMRQVLEKGIHRRRGSSARPSKDEELLKRTFWVLVVIDRLKSSFLGRPCCIQEEDIDVDYPVECDDEYWETDDPQNAFQQPDNKPCKISSFIRLIKLTEILSMALRTLYATKKNKRIAGYNGEEWERRVVVELDSSLNNWKDSLPSYLKWDPNISDSTLFHQASLLHATFNYVQILVHRPFLTKKSSMSFPSLAMCTNAARSCIHALDAARIKGMRPTHHLLVCAFSSGIVIILNLWSHRHTTGLITDPAKEADLQMCINVLKDCDKKWHVAGRFCDMLNEVGALSECQPTSIMKQPRNTSIVEDTIGGHSIATMSPYSYSSSSSARVGHIVPEFPNIDKSGETLNGPADIFGKHMSINDLLLFQTGYVTQPQARLFELDNGALRSGAVETSDILHRTTPSTDNSYSTPGSESFILNDNIPSFWSGIPAAFSADEWDVYLRNTSAGPPV
uniref:Transcription factor domain-containing protein n=1 Tax=Psilocybe cubensis TaxID=181762 RepID=A0A8H8CP76_PSICU